MHSLPLAAKWVENACKITLMERPELNKNWRAISETRGCRAKP